MIVFDLACGGGHVFEAWFGSSADYEDQHARGLVSCPICGDGAVAKAVMAPAVPAKSNQIVPRTAPSKPVPMQNGAASPEQMKAMMTALARMQAKALEGSEHVGRNFASEARAIHDGASEQRTIHGEATPAQAKALIEDGITVSPLPFPVRPPEQLQ